MLTANLIKKHQEIGDLIEAASKAGAFQKMVIGARAVEKNHELMGAMIEKIKQLEAANDD